MVHTKIHKLQVLWNVIFNFVNIGLCHAFPQLYKESNDMMLTEANWKEYVNICS
jgi:hypothetical protein